jgi:sirohydrochlorin ferrochelatase
MKALLLVAHGSRREGSNEEVRALARAMATRADHGFQKIETAFLEIAAPSIPDGLRALIASGAEQITVVPYFLSAGRHVVEDIPSEVQKVVAEHPDVPIHVAPYLGTSSVMPELLVELGAASRQGSSD